MSRVVAVGTSLPEHAYRQDEISRVTSELLTDDPVRRALTRRLHAHAGVETRHLALPLADYGGLSFGSANDAFLAHGTDLAERACRAALDDAGLRADEVDHVVLTTVTGVGAPTLDVLLAARLGLRADVRRTPSFGWGCAGGAAGLARADDLLRGRPRDVALLVAVELCSLTLQRGDPSTANLVASGLFGDGAAAAVLVGDEHRLARRPGAYGAPRRRPGARVVESRSHLHPGTTGDLGWRVGDTGFEIVLSARLPELIGAHLLGDVKALLAEHDLEPADVGAWVVHAGGPRVLDAVRDALGLDDEDLATSRDALRTTGNLSSASVLHVLAATLARTDAPPGVPAVLLAFGPGVSTELVLLRLEGRAPRSAAATRQGARA
ncbi:type III polyketide synthase [Cellulosimicrobium sp. BIT-GX5]|uniref:Type III polyketide synthase n=1 Tax=Cellulosimicrobium composti TaxID=2672572 RepID=A0A6N7ZI71_9MICO|nr:3-oxoacyl-[acyl-carrier-protein] synthase III C-terminal domain-containing protein [Cellulosimicrobium composti]MTG89175.1 type III polyketide synthase [Cellulosimicrobium composti]